MSEPYSMTGKTELRRCPRCDSDVEHHEMVGMYGGPVLWDCDEHDAPCGLPCFGGGVSGRVYRSRQVHGLWGAPARHHPATEWDGAWDSPARPGTPCPACGAHGMEES